MKSDGGNQKPDFEGAKEEKVLRAYARALAEGAFADLKKLYEKEKHILDGAGYAKGGALKPAGITIVGEIPTETYDFCRPLARPEKIKTAAVISAPGVPPYLLVTFTDGAAGTMPLDGPALFNLNNEVAAALSVHLCPSDGGGG